MLVRRGCALQPLPLPSGWLASAGQAAATRYALGLLRLGVIPCA
jgi:hypothetical protein